MVVALLLQPLLVGADLASPRCEGPGAALFSLAPSVPACDRTRHPPVPLAPRRLVRSAGDWWLAARSGEFHPGPGLEMEAGQGPPPRRVGAWLGSDGRCRRQSEAPPRVVMAFAGGSVSEKGPDPAPFLLRALGRRPGPWRAAAGWLRPSGADCGWGCGLGPWAQGRSRAGCDPTLGRAGARLPGWPWMARPGLGPCAGRLDGTAQID